MLHSRNIYKKKLIYYIDKQNAFCNKLDVHSWKKNEGHKFIIYQNWWRKRFILRGRDDSKLHVTSRWKFHKNHYVWLISKQHWKENTRILFVSKTDVLGSTTTGLTFLGAVKRTCTTGCGTFVMTPFPRLIFRYTQF